GVAIGTLFPIARWKAEKRRAKENFETRENTKPAEIADLKIKQWNGHPEFEKELAQFESVFWEPDDTTTLLHWIGQNLNSNEDRILEIGCGTGLVSLYCRQLGAEVVATDINPAAVANTLYNAEQLGLQDGLECRLVSEENPAAFSVIADDEKFDWIISNPPWEDQPVGEVAAYALYDPGFGLLDGILDGASDHLRHDGQLLLAYGARTAIERILSKAPDLGWQVEILDQRDLAGLPEVFVPAMLLILKKSPR
ncbi:MAG: class I SAM-dependent methyltransferase, partial [Planctomycetota bacterium]